MIYLNLADDNRILSAQHMPETETAVESLPDGDITDYKYVNGEFVLGPLPVPPEPEPEAGGSELDDVYFALAELAAMIGG